jgi:hypothetical protein
LFGENQIDSLLQRILTADEQERLAIFPLDGFASDETQEYIRFKLATARFTKELPIDGGIVGVIHNSSRGMPGAINNLVADALNGAVPASEPDEFAGIGPIFSGASSEQAADRDDKTDLEQAWIASIQPRYWAATAALVVLLTGTLLFWDAGPRETQSIPITVAVTPGATQVIDVERLTELAAAVPALTAADAAVVAGVGEFPLTAAVAQGESNLAAVVIAEEVVAAETIAAVNNAAETTQTIAEVAVAEETAVITTTSSFVKRLLQASPGDYAVQLLASHSEASIIDFIAN